MPRKKLTLTQEVDNLKERLSSETSNREMLEEALGVLEQQISEQGWINLFGGNGKELSKPALDTLYDLARLYWLKNPLIKRGVEVQALYVFAQGMTVKADDQNVQVVVKRFMDDRKNIAALTGHQAWLQNEREIALSGNLFIALISDKLSTGRVIARTIPLYEILDILCNPEDSKEPWYYHRSFLSTSIDPATGTPKSTQLKAYYPDWRYNPKEGEKYDKIGGEQVMWNQPVFHLKTNCLSDMKYGVSEVYAGIDWALAYKKFLENWSKLVESYARFAWNMTTKGGSKAITAAKTKIEGAVGERDKLTTQAREHGREVAGVLVSSDSVKMEAIRTQGMTTSADDARRLMLMVCSNSGIPEQIEACDPSTGNLATATAMERPLELQFKNRQQLWKDAWEQILQYAVQVAAGAKNYPGLDAKIEIDKITGEKIVLIKTDQGEEERPKITVTFPPLLEHDVLKVITAIEEGATLSGKPLAGTMDLQTVATLILKALNVDNADEILLKLFPDKNILKMQTDYAQQQGDNATLAAQVGLLHPDTATNQALANAERDLKEAAKKAGKKHGK